MSPRIQAQNRFSVSAGSYLASDEEQRKFFQTRLALVSKIAFALIGGHFLVANSISWIGGRDLLEVLTEPFALNAIANLGIFGAAWFGMSRGNRSWKVLMTVDPLLVICYGTSIAITCYFNRSDPFIVMVAALPVTFAVLARSVIIPGAALRTFVISLIAYVPLSTLAYMTWEGFGAIEPEGYEQPSFINFVLRAVIGSILAAVNSQVIYGLQRKVKKAEQLGQYRLEEKIGEGGMGEVYRGSHAMLRRPTAIKLIQASSAGDNSIARFEREVQLTSQLTHPNTIAIYDFGRTPEGTFYYAMEFLEGMDLEKLVERSGSQPPARVIHVLKQVCASLSEAHHNGLIHRDIKPGNIILCERGGARDVVKVVDFGLVKDTSSRADASISQADTITGTPHYMSPEAIRAPDGLDARSDLYAVGAVGYFLLTGKRLFDGEHFMEVIAKQLDSTPEKPSVRLGRPLPEDLEAVILDCLEKDRDRRPQTARAIAVQLSECRDAGKWTDEDAASWWSAHHEPAGADVASAETIDDEKAVAEAPTIQVDVERRS